MGITIYFNLLHQNIFNFIKTANVTDIVNKSSVCNFITKVAKKNSRVVDVQERIIITLACKKKHRSTTVLEEI